MDEAKQEQLDARTAEMLKEMMLQAVRTRKQAIVYAAARKMYQRFSEDSLQQTDQGGEWESIASLSQLRSLVGGRFQNLKERWLAAGLPLRAHRGDRSEDAEVNKEGWLELSAWIHKQGFQTRLSDETEEGLFQIRKL